MTTDPSTPVDPAALSAVGAGRRERKKSATRLALRDAAIRLVAERGLDGVTVEDITEAADVSTRTFFNYFSAKEQAITAPDRDRLAALRSSLAERPDGESPIASLRAVLIAETDHINAHGHRWLDQLAVIKTDPRLLAALAASWWELETALVAGLVERLGADKRDAAEVAAAVAVATLRVAVRRWKQETAEPLGTILAGAFDALGDTLTATAAPDPRTGL